MRAYEQKCYNSFIILFSFLSHPNTYLSPSTTQLSLSPLWSPSLRCSLFLSHFHFFFFLSLTLFLSLCILVLLPQIRPVSVPLSLSFFFPLSLSLSLSFPVTKKKAIPIWREARQFEPLFADLKLCTPRGSRRSLLIVLHSSHHRSLVEFGHWLICWSGVLLKILSYLFIYLFCWDFWIWNLLEDLVIVVVVCGGGCSGGCCCGSGCSGGCCCGCGCWFLGGGDCH